MPPRLILVDGNKQCTHCKEWKPLDQFVKANNTTTGKAAGCKNCINSKRLIKYHNDTTYRNTFQKQRKKSVLKIKFNLSISEFEDMLYKQSNKCKICGITFNQKIFKKQAHVDHCHITGKVRGLLCVSCNLALGNFKDNIDIMNNAILYIRESL